VDRNRYINDTYRLNDDKDDENNNDAYRLYHDETHDFHGNKFYALNNNAYRLNNNVDQYNEDNDNAHGLYYDPHHSKHNNAHWFHYHQNNFNNDCYYDNGYRLNDYLYLFVDCRTCPHYWTRRCLGFTECCWTSIESYWSSWTSCRPSPSR
jgi:hypothetical protein